MQQPTGIYSFSLGAIICSINLPLGSTKSEYYVLVVIFIVKAIIGGFLSVFTTDFYKACKTFISNRKK